jgi:hypothetical protein
MPGPASQGITGVRAFCGDSTGRICFTADGSEPEVVNGSCSPDCLALNLGSPAPGCVAARRGTGVCQYSNLTGGGDHSRAGKSGIRRLRCRAALCPAARGDRLTTPPAGHRHDGPPKLARRQRALELPALVAQPQFLSPALTTRRARLDEPANVCRGKIPPVHAAKKN